MITQYVKVKTQFDAIHCWPDCPIETVSFLRNPHRHKIYVTVEIETGKDRELEFFMFQHEVNEIIRQLYGDDDIKELGSRSMETICLNILDVLHQKDVYKYRQIIISASEDGENEGSINYFPD